MRALRRAIVALAVIVRRRPTAIIAVVLAAAAAGTAITAARSTPTGQLAGLVGSASRSAAATERAARLFGDDPVVIMVSGQLSRLVLTGDIDRVLGLEGCLAGRQRTAGGPCARLAALRSVTAVAGPGTFINTAATQITAEYERRLAAALKRSERAATDARRLAKARGWSERRGRRAAEQAANATMRQSQLDLLRLGLSAGILRPPTINDQSFVARLVFAAGSAAGTPKPRFAYLFPNSQTALISVRLRADLSDRERADAIADIQAAVAMERWRPRNGGRYTVTGLPVIGGEFAETVGRSLRTLLALAVAAMALTLLLVFDVRRRLVPLAVALVAAVLTLAAVTVVGRSLTLAAVAALPVLVGLVVDHALQFQARVRERSLRHRDEDAQTLGISQAALRAARADAPTIAAAALATAAGACALALSPVPVVRGFGLMLAGGVLVGLLLALTFGLALIVVRSRSAADRKCSAVTASLRGARALIVAGGSMLRLHSAAIMLGRSVLRLSARRRGTSVLLALGLVLAAAGIALEMRLGVESDLERLAPRDLPALSGARALQRATGIAGQVEVIVEARDVTDRKVIAWMTDYRRTVLRRVGYSEQRGCGRAALCPSFSLTDLPWGTSGEQISGVLAALPPSMTRTVMTADRRTATIAFGVRLIDLKRQHRLLQTMRAELRPPDGVHAQLAGTAVLAADGHAALAAPWRRLTMLASGLVAITLVLRLLLGSWRRALVPLVPIVLAVGWAALPLAALGVRLNPLSVTLNALVIAIATEFSVLLSERYRRELSVGGEHGVALRRTYGQTGIAVAASGATATVGFAVLMLSDIPLLRDFAVVAVIDLVVALAAVMLVLPIVLSRWGEAGQR